MLTVEEALDLVLDRARELPPVRRPLAEALDCQLAEDVIADIDLPPFDKALMDGYAVRSSDLAGNDQRLDLGEVILAGQTPSRPLGPREAAVIMTGAPLPAEADAVVMHERTRKLDGAILVEEPEVRPGQNRLPRGREVRAGQVVFPRGFRLNPASLGGLASVGRTQVRVIPRPKVAVLPTGDELVEPDQIPGPGQIRNSNAVMLRSLAIQQGCAAEPLPIAPDDPEELRLRLEQGLKFDILLITGGVSAGQRDLVPDTLEHLGVNRVFHKIRLKPGKPLWFGVGPARETGPGTLVFGLPGNPVSGLVGFLLFVQPALNVLAGRAKAGPELREAGLSREFVHRGDRPTYYPARWLSNSDGDHSRRGIPAVEPLDWAGSADLLGAARADGFAVFPAGDRVFKPGEIVRFLPLG